MGIRKRPLLIFLLLLLLLLFFDAAAQPTGRSFSQPQDNTIKWTKYPRWAIVVLITGGLLVVGFISIRLLCQCITLSWYHQLAFTFGFASSNRNLNLSIGLGRKVIESFPVFAYSEVKDLEIGKGTLECAICISEFEYEDTLRLLPKCNHVFHVECIDSWLASQITCPICRATLLPHQQDGETQSSFR